MFARCGPVTAVSAGQAGGLSRLPVIPQVAFRRRHYSASSATVEKPMQQPQQPFESSHLNDAERLPFDDAQLTEQLEAVAPTDVLRRIFIGPHSKIRSRDISHRVKAMQRHAEQTELDRHLGELGGSASWISRRLRPPPPPPPALAASKSSDQRNAFLTTLDLLRLQLKACNTPEDILHLITITSQSTNPHALEYIGSQSFQRIMLAKVKNMGVGEEWKVYDNERTIGFINILHARLAIINVPLILPWFTLAVQKATAAMNTDALRRWLILYTQHLRLHENQSIPNYQVTDILQDIATAVISYKKLHPKDSYIWTRKAQALHAILTNLPNPSASSSQPEDLSMSSQLYWHSRFQVKQYMYLLSHLGPVTTSEDILIVHKKASSSMYDTLNPATIHALLRIGDGRAAWEMLASMTTIHPKDGAKLWPKLLEVVDAMSRGLLDKPGLESLKAATESGLADALAHKMLEMEESMGLRWVENEIDGGGQHMVKRRIRLAGRILEHNYVPIDVEELPLQEAIEKAEQMLHDDYSWVDMHN